MIVIFMGVCGCGKTSTGQLLAQELGWEFRDADEFHSAANKEKMANGTPLTDEDRIPWLQALNQQVQRWYYAQQSGILTCSALRASYRKLLLNGTEQETYSTSSKSDYQSPDTSVHCDLGVRSDIAMETRDKSLPEHNRVVFVYLKGTKEVIAARMAARQGHFMPETLLQSQFDTLEEPDASEPAVTININNSLVDIVMMIRSLLSL